MNDVSDPIVVYLDDSTEPLLTESSPAELKIDTRQLEDGEHSLRVEARDRRGRKGIRHIPFVVRNGPAIHVQGLQEGEVVEGPLSLTLHAFGGGDEENWEPAQAEIPAPVPTWAWVVVIAVVAWSMYYAVTSGMSAPPS